MAQTQTRGLSGGHQHIMATPQLQLTTAQTQQVTTIQSLDLLSTQHTITAR